MIDFKQKIAEKLASNIDMNFDEIYNLLEVPRE